MQRKWLFLFLCFIMLFSLVFDFSTPVLAEGVTGFRGITWGDPLPKEGMKLIEKKQYAGKLLSSYRRTGDELKIGTANLESITYLFWDGRLYSINITCTGSDNQKALLNAFKERLGFPTQSDNDFYAWIGETTTAYLRYKYSYNLKFDYFMKTEAKLVSDVIAKEMFTWEREQTKKGKNDF